MATEEAAQDNRGSEAAMDTIRGAEGEEKPVRERLEHTAISSQKGSPTPDASDPDASQATDDASGRANGKGRPARKRSLEDLKEPEPGLSILDAPATPSSGTHLRKKTREQKDSEGVDDEDIAQGSDSPGSSSPANRTGRTRADGAAPTPPLVPQESAMTGSESPRKKRSAEDMDTAAHKPKIVATEEAQIARKSLDETRPVLDATTASSQSNGVSTAAKPSGGAGGFGNASSSSPFASFGGKPGESKPSGLSSGFSSAGAASSPFGAFGSSGGAATTTTLTNQAQGTGASSTSSKLSFANATSPFGSGSAFGGGSGKLSSFAAAKGDFVAPPAGGKLASFAAPGGGDFRPAGAKLSTFASPGGGDFGVPSKSKLKAAQESTDDNEQEDGSEDESDNTETEGGTFGVEVDSKEEDDTDRSQGPKIPPGEEEEETLFVSRAKLHVYTEGVWKERGTGIFKLNIHRDSDLFPTPADYEELDNGNEKKSEDDDPEAQAEAGGSKKDSSDTPTAESNKTQARFIMRTNATHKIIINAPIFKQMMIGDAREHSKAPVSKQMVFAVPEGGKLSMFLLRIGREDELTNLYQLVKIIQKKL